MLILSHPTPVFFEKKTETEIAARVAAFLRGFGLDVENTGATGVRSDWMEQDGPGLFLVEKKEESLGVPLEALPTYGDYIHTETMHRLTL